MNASGAVVAVRPVGQSHTFAGSYEKATLFLGLTCHVSRPLKFVIVFSFQAGPLARSGSYVHTFGLPAFLLKNTGANVHARAYRKAPLNHTLSRLSGPPMLGLTS